jgi:hypothetical protein
MVLGTNARLDPRPGDGPVTARPAGPDAPVTATVDGTTLHAAQWQVWVDIPGELHVPVLLAT